MFSPSIVPGSERDIYLVLDDYGRLGRSWPETGEEDTDRETLLRHLMEGQYSNPGRIVSFNTSEGWSRDASEDIADELHQRCMGDIPVHLEDFIARNAGSKVLQLLPMVGL